MAKQGQDHRRECRHFLWLAVRAGTERLDVWARCRNCKRGWFLGSHADVTAGLSVFDGVAAFEEAAS